MKHLSNTQLQLSCSQYSSAGVKAVNEDSIGIRIPEGNTLLHKGAVACIADGVSAAEAGREASQACVQNFLYDYFCTSETWTVQKSAQSVLSALNRWLYSQGTHYQDASKGYITTLSILVLKSCTAHIIHIGDTRIYRIRRGEIECLTQDHTRRVGNNSYLGRAMGLDTKLQADYRKDAIEQNDIYVLSSDGIHDFYPSNHWIKLLQTHQQDLDQFCRALVDQALQANSSDNLSAQAIRVDRLPANNAAEAKDNLCQLPFPPPLEIGQSLDGLTVQKVLHESNRSQLYLVETNMAGKPVKLVMKTPSLNYSDDAAYIERFSLEPWLGKHIRHSKIVSVIDNPNTPTALYYLMEHCDGITLEQWIKLNPKASIQDTLNIARQIALALRALNRKEIIHQDLKPGNIMIDHNQQITVIDFGACLMAGLAELPKPIEREIALGTETYSAPEYALDQQGNHQSDIFSLAVIIYEMLSDTLPYGGSQSSIHSYKELDKLKYKSVCQHNPMVPLWFDGALKKALSLRPEDRYIEVDEFIHDLETPNPSLISNRVPIAQRNPLMFWQLLCFAQLLLLLILLGAD